MAIDVSALYPQTPEARASAGSAALSDMAGSMVGSRILGIAGQVKAMKAEDPTICNLTVGDFSPEQFRIPPVLATHIESQLQAGETNYPPADGMPELRSAIVDFYTREAGLSFPFESIVVGSGARPPIFAAYACLLAPGDTLLYAIPSWNNEYYVHLNRARAIGVPTRPEDGFMPTLADLAPHLGAARVLHLNSPLNPCGTCISEQALREICQAVVAENKRRESTGEKSLFLLYDMVYWLLTYGESRHHHPISLVPEIAPYLICVDAISKWFAATGLRVGWGIVPPYIQGRFKAFIGHMGAWAPRPVQLACASLLQEPEEVNAFLTDFKAQIHARLDCIYNACERMAAAGLPVRAIEPQGAIYLSVQMDLRGRKGPDGTRLETNEQVRELLLHQARVAVVPFRAFGLEEESGWFRMSVGAVGLEELEEGMARIEATLRSLG